VTGLTLGLIRPKRWIVVLKQHIPEKNVTFGIPPFTKLLQFRILAVMAAPVSDGSPGNNSGSKAVPKNLLDKG
jgi:hypothetical protein